MITKHELAIILQDNGFTDTEIETILNKRIKKLLNAGQEQNIKESLFPQFFYTDNKLLENMYSHLLHK